MTHGVAIEQLHCPTCHVAYELPLIAHCDDDTELTTAETLYSLVCRPRLLYVCCRHGHKWTIQSLVYEEGQVSAVLLGQYIGA